MKKWKRFLLFLTAISYKFAYADGLLGLKTSNTAIISGAGSSKLDPIAAKVVNMKVVAYTLSVAMIATAVFTLYFNSENSLKIFAKLFAVLGIVALAYISLSM